ncbi:hypothetical protein NODU109028_10370 [Nocardioides dubius]
MRITPAVVALAVAASLTACGSDEEPTAKPASPVASGTAPAEPSEPAAEELSEEDSSEESSIGEVAQLKVGQDFVYGPVTINVESVAQPAQAPIPSFLSDEEAAQGALLKAKVCLAQDSPDTLDVSSYDFYAYDANGGEYTVANMSWNGWPTAPEFPSEAVARPGRCVSGSILMSAPKRTVISYVSYGGGYDTVAEWEVK